MSYGFAGRRVQTGTFTLASREAAKVLGKPLKDPEFRSEAEWEIYHPIEERLAQERKYLTSVVLRMKIAKIPSDCNIDILRTPKEKGSEHMYTVLDDCNIPPELIEICDLPEGDLDALGNQTIDNDVDVG